MGEFRGVPVGGSAVGDPLVVDHAQTVFEFVSSAVLPVLTDVDALPFVLRCEHFLKLNTDE